MLGSNTRLNHGQLSPRRLSNQSQPQRVVHTRVVLVALRTRTYRLHGNDADQRLSRRSN